LGHVFFYIKHFISLVKGLKTLYYKIQGEDSFGIRFSIYFIPNDSKAFDSILMHSDSIQMHYESFEWILKHSWSFFRIIRMHSNSFILTVFQWNQKTKKCFIILFYTHFCWFRCSFRCIIYTYAYFFYIFFGCRLHQIF